MEFDLIWHDGHDVADKCAGPGHLASRPDGRSVFLQNWMFFRRIKRCIRSHLPDIVQVNPAAFPFVGLLPLGMPSSVHFIIDWRQLSLSRASGFLNKSKQVCKREFRTIASRYAFDRATFLHACAAESFLGSSWARSATVVPIGVDERFLSAPVRIPSDENNSKVRFLYVGTLSLIRKLDCLLTAAAILKQKTTNFELHLIGPDNANGYYQEEIRRLAVNDVVAVLPAVPYADVPELVADADVVLAYVPEEPADWQYQPTLKILEYRAMGVPMIATDIEPNRLEVEHDVNGFLCVNDPAAWADAMAKFVEDRQRLRYFWRRAQSMRRALTWRDVAVMYERDVYLPATSKQFSQ
jgi:glycosyltransferase involved in cell wall biosynthesis